MTWRHMSPREKLEAIDELLRADPTPAEAEALAESVESGAPKPVIELPPLGWEPS